MNKNSKPKTKTDDENIYKEILIKGQVYKDVYSKKDLWKDLAKMFDGEFKIKQTISKDINSFQLEIPYKNHKIILTETDTKPLKFEMKLKLNRKFEFNISWEDSIERIMKIFGKQDIIIGNNEFDKKYIIQSNEPELITHLLNYREVSKILLKHNIYLLTMEYDKKYEEHKFMTVKDRNTKGKEVMIELINLEFRIIDFFINNNLMSH